MSKSRFLVGLVALAITAAACSSTTHNSTSTTTTGSTSGTGTSATSTGGGGGKTITIGLLNDVTGAAASGNKTALTGAQAGATVAAKDGFNFKFVVGDTQSSPSGALSAAHKLVQQDHVTAVIAVSALAFSAAPYLTQQGIPVVGYAEDGSEWAKSSNMFSVFGYIDSTVASSTFGQFMKMEGVTNVGSLGYGISPQSAASAKGSAKSAKAAGLTVGYLNANFPFGSTNVAPIAIAMKSGGVTGFTASVDPNTSFALITAFRQAGGDLKVAILPDGYGGDLVQAGAGALQAGQGVYFSISFEPVEMNTPATQKFVSALRQVGVTGDPTYAEYGGYTSVALLDEALKVTGDSPSHSALISALNGIKGFDAWGLTGTHTFDLANRSGTSTGVDACLWVTKLQGSSFQTVPNADPICGTPLP